ncbi:MAG: FAD:protein FMN transferase [Desulfobacterales bacterium]|nr:FAD:protein FMN transferase [Desulfobacterales bacterium]
MVRESYQLPEHGYIDRRDFLRICGIAGLGLATCPVGAPLAEAVRFDRRLYKVSKSRIGMGTIVSITVLNPSRDHAEEAVAVAFEEIERLTKMMSRHDASTPVAQLNRYGFLKEAPPELSFMIKESMHYHQISNHLFDITVKPLLDLFVRSYKDPKHVLPSEEKITEVLELVDAELVSLNGKTIEFKRDGMGITLDGIAKGFIVDKAVEKLILNGINHGLVNAGGDIRTIGDKGNNRPWKIAVEDPLKKKDYPDTVAITNRSIATSGNYEVFFDQEKIFHHIVNPKTGLSPLINASVSVQAPTAMEADALSTTLFILDPVGATRLINSLPSCQSLIVTRNRKRIKSSGWQGIRI